MARQNLIFQSRFEGSDPYVGFDLTQKQDAGYPYSRQILPGGREGTPYLRQEVRYNDTRVSSGTRSEIVPKIPGGDTGDMWYGYSCMFEKLDGGWGGSLMQWHPTDNTGSANVGMWPYDKTLQIVRSISKTNYYQPTAKPVVFNKWYDIVFHIKWSTGDDGIVEVWVDGERTYYYKGKNTEAGAYMKCGINRWGSASNGGPTSGTWITRLSNIRIGRNTSTTPVGYADVMPGDTVPTPNKPPVANAGTDQIIKSPSTSATLIGIGSDSDGLIAGYNWKQVAGPAASFSNATAANTTVVLKDEGEYEFSLTVTDNAGATASDNVKVTKLPADPTPPPVVNNKLMIVDTNGAVKFSGEITGDVKIVL